MNKEGWTIGDHMGTLKKKSENIVDCLPLVMWSNVKLKFALVEF